MTPLEPMLYENSEGIVNYGQGKAKLLFKESNNTKLSEQNIFVEGNEICNVRRKEK